MGDALKVGMGACEVEFDGTALGYTIGGVKVAYSFDSIEKTVDQEDTPIDEIVTKQNFEVTVPMAEYDIQKFVKVIPGAALVGDHATTPTKLKLVLTGASGRSLRTMAGKLIIKPLNGAVSDWITIYSAMPKPNIDFAYEKENTRVYNIVFRAVRTSGGNFVTLGDTSLNSGMVQIAGDQTVDTDWFTEPVAKPTITSITATPSTGITTSTSVAFAAVVTGTPDTYLWDFGDGYTSMATAPSHTFATAGTYSVTLTIWNATGQATMRKVDMITSAAA